MRRAAVEVELIEIERVGGGLPGGVLHVGAGLQCARQRVMPTALVLAQGAGEPCCEGESLEAWIARMLRTRSTLLPAAEILRALHAFWSSPRTIF